MRITRIFSQFASVGLLSIQAAPEESYNCDVSVDGSCEQSQPECSLYMAESTIPGAGLGIFTGVERLVNETIGTGDVMFPLVDVAYHMQVLGTKILHHHPDIVTNPTMDYIWFGPEMGMQQETAHPYVQVEFVSAFAPGLDAAINCHLGLPNVEKTMPIYDTAGLHRSKDPGTGGFTPYHKCTTYVTHPIPAGGKSSGVNTRFVFTYLFACLFCVKSQNSLSYFTKENSSNSMGMVNCKFISTAIKACVPVCPPNQ